MPFAALWMDLEITILSEVSQKDKDKYYDITYMWNLENKDGIRALQHYLQQPGHGSNHLSMDR